ncbi:hypothetical protein M569_06671 [Genlisea aurea]|uniref:Glycosyltransferase n=1 Tax=Genlisea aurea TaxID=192259 RepID=S8DXV5_9LAMI|nr:hypothetical protein M569_06671 [Genlisea aurea]
MEKPKTPHILLLPYPATGHINPMLHFAKYLASKSIQITLIVPTQGAKSPALANLPPSISHAVIGDDSDQPTLFNEDKTVDLETHFKRFRSVYIPNLLEFIHRQGWGRNPDETAYPKAMVYDSTMPWLLEVAAEKGMKAAPFFTECCGVNALCYHLNKGNVTFPYEEEFPYRLPSLPALEAGDLLYLPDKVDKRGDIVRYLAAQFELLENADYILVNTFYHLEPEVLDWLEERYPKQRAIGPTFLLPGIDAETAAPQQESYSEWLDSKQPNSVIFVSFGTIVTFGGNQMEEVAHALLMSNRNFLWVVRNTEEVEKLPREIRESEAGLIVNWCHQSRVLSHPAVSCFMTHCGWNSTLEALSIGVPIVAMPRWTDQTANAKFIEDTWRVGVRLKRGWKSDEIFGRERIAKCIEEVVNGVELRKNCLKWKALAVEAVRRGGTSIDSVEEFVRELLLIT